MERSTDRFYKVQARVGYELQNKSGSFWTKIYVSAPDTETALSRAKHRCPEAIEWLAPEAV